MFESCRAHQPSLLNARKVARRSYGGPCANELLASHFQPTLWSPSSPSGFVNNSEQFAADLVDGLAQRSVEHLRVHVQRCVDVGVTHQLRDDFSRHTPIV